MSIVCIVFVHNLSSTTSFILHLSDLNCSLFFFNGNLELYSEKIKREHYVKELAQESKNSLPSIQENHICLPHI